MQFTRTKQKKIKSSSFFLEVEKNLIKQKGRCGLLTFKNATVKVTIHF